jgi:hypothetical protein
MTMFSKKKYFSIILFVIVFAFFTGGCGLFKKSSKKTTVPQPKAAVQQKKVAEQKEEKAPAKEPEKTLKEEKPEKRKITIGETTKAYIIANYGKPKKLFWSKDAEEILIYNRISEIGDNVLIFLNNKGIVRNILVQPKE